MAPVRERLRRLDRSIATDAGSISRGPAQQGVIMRLKDPKNPPPGHMRLALYANSEEPNETPSQPKGYSDPKNLSKYSKKTSPMTYPRPPLP